MFLTFPAAPCFSAIYKLIQASAGACGCPHNPSNKPTNPRTDFQALSFSVLPHRRFSRTLKGMEVHFAPDLQARIDQLVIKTGRPPDKLLEDAMAG